MADTFLPRRPGDIAHDALLRDLVARLDELTGASLQARYVEHRHPDPAMVLAELAVATEIAERMRQRRACTMREALRSGATVEKVAAAVGTDPAEVRAALLDWAAGQHRYLPDRFTEQDEAEVHALTG